MKDSPYVPGPEMDAVVAEKVMGYRWEEWETGRGLYAPDGTKVAKRFKKEGMRLVVCDIDGSECVATRPLPEFSTRIAAAWDVLEHLSKTANVVVVLTNSYGHYVATVHNTHAKGTTAPLAICRAALGFVREKG